MSRKRSVPEQTVALPEKKPKLCLYLDDNTPIRTIVVANVPTDLSEDRCKAFIQGYFERDGPVEHVEIAKKSDKEWLAYVTFVLPEDAAELIHKADTPEYTRCSKYPIKIADDELQIKIDPNVMNLEKVNDHCLLYIMSQLNFIDAINLCKTSTRMQLVGELYFRKFTKFSFGTETDDPSINEANLPVILEAIGEHIWFIDWHNITAAHFELLVKHCPNVTEMKLKSAKRDFSGALYRNRNFFTNLKRLYLESCNHIYDNNLKHMLSGRNVKTLDVKSCHKLRGNFFSTLNRGKMRTVKVINCAGVKDTNCFSLGEWKNKLSILSSDLCCCYLPIFTLPPEKLQRFKELELDFSCFKGVTVNFNFGALKKLTKLTLTRTHQLYNYIDSNNMINGLTKIDSLQSLTLHGIYVNSNTVQALRSIRNLRCLRLLGIDNKIGKNLYESFRDYMAPLQELSIYIGRLDGNVIGKPIFDMLVGMPNLEYFSHSSITWQWLDVIGQMKWVAEKKSPLKIGVPEFMFNDLQKVTFEAAHQGAIVLSIHEPALRVVMI